MAQAQIKVLGRALTLRPGVYGQALERLCTVTRTVNKESFDEFGRYLGRRPAAEKIPMFWYSPVAEVPDERLFCSYAGFLGAIQAELQRLGVTVEVEDLVSDGLGPPELGRLKGVTWRSGQKETMARLLANKRGIVDCPVGWGKTFIIQCLAKIWPSAEIIVTVPFGDVAKQTYAELRAQLGDFSVGMVGKGRSRSRRVTVCTSQSLHKLSKEANLVLVDECHAVCTPLFVKKLNKFHRARMFGFSASYGDRSDRADRLAQALFGDKLIRVGYEDAVIGGNVVPILVRMHRVKHGPNLAGVQDKTYVDRVGIWRNAVRNTTIAEAVRAAEAELGDDAQILVMVDTFEHACLLQQLLPNFVMATGEPEPARVKKLLSEGVLLPSQEVCTEEKRQAYRLAFEAHELKRAIATKIWRQGVNFADLAVLVRADGAASGVDATQVPGRLARLGKKTLKYQGILIDFMDEFSDNLKSRSMARRRCYEKHHWTVTLV